MNGEQRKDGRFLPQELTFIVFRPQFTKLGKLINISRGGLAFRYMVSNGQEEISTQLDIFMRNNRFFLSSIPCKIIYETEQSGLSSLKTRRCGVQFEKLTKGQASRLGFYLKNHTAGRAS